MRAASTVWLLVATAVAFAEDRPAPPAGKSAPPEEDAIVGAKRQFEALKAAPGGPAQAAAHMPSFATPDFTPGAPAPHTPAARAEAAATARKKSANWLVDAMAEKGKKIPGRDGRNGTQDGDDINGAVESPSGEREPGEKARAAPRKSFEPGLNPLDHYLATWMTPQDLALLRPVMRSDPSGLPDRMDFGLASPNAAAPGTSPAGAVGLLLSGPAASGASAAPRDNPFLQSLTPPAQPGGTLLPPLARGPAAPPPASSLMAPPPNPPPAPKSVTPGFVKPREDEKYYKQMKRF